MCRFSKLMKYLLFFKSSLYRRDMDLNVDAVLFGTRSMILILLSALFQVPSSCFVSDSSIKCH